VSAPTDWLSDIRSREWRRALTAHGFTLVELLTVIAVIGLLVALLLPAVQAARESSRRTQCGSQLRQLGIAATSYAAAKGTFPPGVKQRSFAAAVSHRGVPLFAFMAPYFEQGALLADWDYEDPLNNANQGLASNAAAVLPGLICPSDEILENPITTAAKTWTYALTSYGGSGGARSFFPAKATADGIFFTTGEASEPEREQRPVAPADVSDGLSNTLFFGERSHYDSNYATFNQFGWGEPLALLGWWGASGSRKMIGHVTMSAHAPINYRLPFSYDARSGQSPPADSFAEFEHYSDMRVCAFGSEHVGGANFCFADGSLRYLVDDTDLEALRAMSTRAGDE
jgi:prepilin-type N-terminal cleavage/methylation domain-containing protein/prepilin-type processing-associated H-X9-DG protein